jgi:hypothetical protein
VSDLDVNIDDDDGSTNNYDLRNLEQFLDKNGLTFTPDDLASISEVLDSFLGMIFLKFL